LKSPFTYWCDELESVWKPLRSTEGQEMADGILVLRTGDYQLNKDSIRHREVRGTVLGDTEVLKEAIKSSLWDE
jgi:hypothetical protein